ncbi:hypothetical protein Tco_1491209 [Tanacetum coccineum]
MGLRNKEMKEEWLLGNSNIGGQGYKKVEGIDDDEVTPKTSYLNTVKRIFKYLKGKPNLGLWTYFFMELQRNSPLVATSTTEAEYVVLFNCCGQITQGFGRCKEGVIGDFSRKPDESDGFAEIVYFLRGSNLMYALITNPTIHDSLVKQFWQTATATTLADGTLELKATIDTIEYTITEASIRSKLQLADASGITMLPTWIFEGMGHMGYPTDGSFTFWKSFLHPNGDS